MENRIILKFGKAETRLAGNPFGKATYISQAKDKIDYNAINVVVFPNNIEKIASSFSQGFFSEIIKRVGYAEFKNVIKIEAKSQELENIVYKDLLP